MTPHRKLIFDSTILSITINRLCQHLVENHSNFSETILLGIQPRGVYLADRIINRLTQQYKIKPQYGKLDVTFFRDDFRRDSHPLTPNTTEIDFIVDNKNVVLVDDVLGSGRTVRSALDALLVFGRPKKVELLVLINRKYNRELPIEPTYVGKYVNVLANQKVLVELKEQDGGDKIWLVNK